MTSSIGRSMASIQRSLDSRGASMGGSVRKNNGRPASPKAQRTRSPSRIGMAKAAVGAGVGEGAQPKGAVEAPTSPAKKQPGATREGAAAGAAGPTGTSGPGRAGSSPVPPLNGLTALREEEHRPGARNGPQAEEDPALGPGKTEDSAEDRQGNKPSRRGLRSLGDGNGAPGSQQGGSGAGAGPVGEAVEDPYMQQHQQHMRASIERQQHQDHRAGPHSPVLPEQGNRRESATSGHTPTPDVRNLLNSALDSDFGGDEEGDGVSAGPWHGSVQAADQSGGNRMRGPGSATPTLAGEAAAASLVMGDPAADGAARNSRNRPRAMASFGSVADDGLLRFQKGTLLNAASPVPGSYQQQPDHSGEQRSGAQILLGSIEAAAGHAPRSPAVSSMGHRHSGQVWGNIPDPTAMPIPEPLIPGASIDEGPDEYMVAPARRGDLGADDHAVVLPGRPAAPSARGLHSSAMSHRLDASGTPGTERPIMTPLARPGSVAETLPEAGLHVTRRSIEDARRSSVDRPQTSPEGWGWSGLGPTPPPHPPSGDGAAAGRKSTGHAGSGHGHMPALEEEPTGSRRSHGDHAHHHPDAGEPPGSAAKKSQAASRSGHHLNDSSHTSAEEHGVVKRSEAGGDETNAGKGEAGKAAAVKVASGGAKAAMEDEDGGPEGGASKAGKRMASRHSTNLSTALSLDSQGSGLGAGSLRKSKSKDMGGGGGARDSKDGTGKSKEPDQTKIKKRSAHHADFIPLEGKSLFLFDESMKLRIKVGGGVVVWA